VDEALRVHAPDLSGQVVYACGSPAMVESVRRVALAAGAAASDIHADAFVSGPVAAG
jgi:ferredoxin-NADP reductase